MEVALPITLSATCRKASNSASSVTFANTATRPFIWGGADMARSGPRENGLGLGHAPGLPYYSTATIYYNYYALGPQVVT